MNFLEKYRNKFIRFSFPFTERLYVVICIVLISLLWFLPEIYWQLKEILLLLLFIVVDIQSSGSIERDYLPIQPRNSIFYHIYRLLDNFFLLFMLILILVTLIPGLTRIKVGLWVAFVIGSVLRAIGEWKYRRKKPEE